MKPAILSWLEIVANQFWKYCANVANKYSLKRTITDSSYLYHVLQQRTVNDQFDNLDIYWGNDTNSQIRKQNMEHLVSPQNSACLKRTQGFSKLFLELSRGIQNLISQSSLTPQIWCI